LKVRIQSARLEQGKTLDVVSELFRKARADDQLPMLDQGMNIEIRLDPEDAWDVAAHGKMGVQVDAH
jgi:hypothetical protein